MSVFKRGKTWWFEFWRDGVRYQKSTRQRNYKAAQDIEKAFSTALAKNDVGITERPKVPTLASFRERFLGEITVRRREHPETIDYYTRKYDGLLKFKPLASAPLDRIDEELIARFIQTLVKDKRARSTMNHHLRTLKRALRLAARWKLIAGVPQIQLLDGENQREYVLPRSQEAAYLAACPEFLANAAEFILQTGVRRKELTGLRWSDVHWDPVGNAKRGYVTVHGTKSKKSKRNLSLTERARQVLIRQRAISKCEFVFVADIDRTRPASAYALDHAHARVRTVLELPAEFVLHSLRHTFATRLGESGADSFRIMRILGHSSITISERYVHPTPEAMERAFAEFESLETSETVPTEVPTGSVPGSGMVQ